MPATQLQLIRRRRATRPTRVRVPVQAFPDGIERDYLRTLYGMVDEMHHAIMGAIPELFITHDAEKTEPLHIISTKIENIETEIYATVSKPKARLLAQGVGRKLVTFNANAINQQVKAVIGINPIASAQTVGAAQVLVDQFARENVDLIRTVPARYFEQVRDVVTESHVYGRRANVVRELLQERHNVARFNAERIARDQVNKLNGKLTETRHKALGIKHYFWRTSNDERVRPEHAALEGQRFAWDDSPPDGHPGEAILCRCRAEPDFSAFIGD